MHMNAKPRSPEETYGPALEKARRELIRLDPVQAAVRAGATYGALGPTHGRLLLPFFGTACHVLWPAGTVQRAADGQPVDISTQLILLHYLLAADGTPMADQWIAFRNLPGALGYDSAFQGRATLRLVQAFGTNKLAFETAARALGGERLAFGNASFNFRVLPCLWLGVVLYLADDEFPASANVLFDASASHYLPTEDLAVLGGILAGQLLRAGRAQ